MQTKAKSNSVVTHSWDEATQTLTVHVLGAGPLVEGKPTNRDVKLNLRRLSDPVRMRAVRHGMLQRLMDAAALGRDTVTGLSATPAAKAEAIKRLADHYASGSDSWSPEREGVVLDGVLLAAVAEATGKGIDEVKGMVERGAKAKGVTEKEYLTTLGTADLVVPIVARIRAGRTGVSANDIFAEMQADAEASEEGGDETGEEGGEEGEKESDEEGGEAKE